MADVFAGRFELVDPIGTGASGVVWRAWDRRHARWCAAKVLRQRDAGALLRFVREQGLRLSHPNVLSPYGWAADDDQALLAMDLVGGGALSTLIADFGPLPERYAAGLLAQLLTALDHIHDTGVVHRDVKPANLLLEATGTAEPVLRLSDFGIALSLGEPRLTRHGTVVGTPGYLAPEILAGGPPSVAQDLYAAGVTGWQLLTGTEPPTRGSLDAPADSPLWQVIRTLVDPDPDLRAGSAAAALEALAPLLATPLPLPSRTTDGEPIEVFDHLPPPPPNTHPPATTQSSPPPYHPAAHSAPPSAPSPTQQPAAQAAPQAAQAAPQAAPRSAPQAAQQIGPQAATQPAPQAAPSPAHPTASSAGRSRGGGGARAGSPRPTPPTVVGVDGSPTRVVGFDATGSPAAVASAPPEAKSAVEPFGESGEGQEKGRRGVAVGVVAAAVAVAGIGIGGYLWLGDPGQGGGGGTPTAPPTSTATTGPTAGTTDPTTGPTSGPTSAGSTRPPEGDVKVGGVCGWQQAGSPETAADGTRVECRRQGDGYRWVKLG